MIIGGLLTISLGLFCLVVCASWTTRDRGWNNVPPPTKRSWTAKDILGTWRYTETDGAGATITITFNEDGTFLQTVEVTSTHKKLPAQQGTWALQPSQNPSDRNRGFSPGHLNVYGVLMDMGGKWEPHNWDWWNVVDSDLRPGQFAIVGGYFPDPDVYQEFVKVP